MRKKILLIALALGFAQLTVAQEKSYGSTRSNKQTINTKVKDSTELKTKANHNTTRSNKNAIKSSDNEVIDSLKTTNGYDYSHRLTRGTKYANKEDSENSNDSLQAKTKANHNTTRSNQAGGIILNKEKDTISSKAKDHNSSRSNKTSSIKIIDTLNTKTNINTSRSNNKGQ